MANKLIPNNNNIAINTQYKEIITQENIELLKGKGMEEIFNNENAKIESIDIQIGILEQKASAVNGSRKLTDILPKYITFLKYIKKIIQVKIIKDITIVKLINDVFIQVNDVIAKMDNKEYGRYTSKNYNTKKKELQELKRKKLKKII